MNTKYYQDLLSKVREAKKEYVEAFERWTNAKRPLKRGQEQRLFLRAQHALQHFERVKARALMATLPGDRDVLKKMLEDV